MITRGPQEVSINGKMREVEGDHYAHFLALASCLRLSEDGVAVFVVTPSFFTDRGNRVRSLLAEIGFSVTSAIELPGGFVRSVNKYSDAYCYSTEV